METPSQQIWKAASIRELDSAQAENGWVERLQRSIHTLTQLATYEAAKPGRKLLFWVGPGWPLLIASSSLLTPKNQMRFFESIIDVNTKLRQAQITLYSVAPPNLSQSSGLRTFVYQDYLNGVQNARQADSPNLAVQAIAFQSGGQILNTSGDLAAQIAQCVSDSDHYYQLSFDAVPATKANEFHSLQINLDKSGLTARTTKEYYLQP